MMKTAAFCGLALLGQHATNGVLVPYEGDDFATGTEDVDVPFDHNKQAAMMQMDGEANAKSSSSSEARASSGAASAAAAVDMTSAAFKQAVKAEVDKELASKLEEKMKFFPAMTSMSQLLQWNTTVAGPRVGQSKLPIQLPNGRRIMSMHDMAGGYQELSDNDYLSMFKSWPLVDLFVYFSHCRIGVPPEQWTAMAHEHGRPAMGTLIFEGGNEADSKVINTKRKEVISQLVQVADHYGFDGWFVNIEGGMWDKGDPEKFVGELKTGLKKKLGNHSQVIAYPYGPHDKMFKEADGVFMQYNWGMEQGAMSSLLEQAGDRKHDIYMGTDSFGHLRGNDEPDPAHVKACAKNDLSLAVFAPGFTLEHGANRTVSLLAVDYDERYWESIAKNFGRNVMSNGEWPVAPEPKGHSLSEFKDQNLNAPTNGQALPDPEMAVMTRYAGVSSSSGAATPHATAARKNSRHLPSSHTSLSELQGQGAGQYAAPPRPMNGQAMPDNEMDAMQRSWQHGLQDLGLTSSHAAMMANGGNGGMNTNTAAAASSWSQPGLMQAAEQPQRQQQHQYQAAARKQLSPWHQHAGSAYGM